VLEVARVIFSKTGQDPEKKKKLVGVMMALGDLHMEIGDFFFCLCVEFRFSLTNPFLLLFLFSFPPENFPRAVEDFDGCLGNLRDIVDPLDRQLAEVYFKISLAYTFDKSFVKAREALLAALGILENRVAHLKETSPDSSSAEIHEIEGILSLMAEKVFLFLFFFSFFFFFFSFFLFLSLSLSLFAQTCFPPFFLRSKTLISRSITPLSWRKPRKTSQKSQTHFQLPSFRAPPR
jgi:hypothetical protein